MQPMFRSSMFMLVVLAALALIAPPAAAQAPAAVINGGGHGILSDPDGNSFPIQFAIAGTVAADGSASGHINFVFRGEMANYYGIVPDEDTFHVYGKPTSGSVAADGTVTLWGTVTAVDFNNGEGKLLVTNDPFMIMAGGSLGDDAFIFQFCELPIWHVVVSSGGLDSTAATSQFATASSRSGVRAC
jgi:hypothetical protein